MHVRFARGYWKASRASREPSQMNPTEICDRLQTLVRGYDPSTFPLDLLSAYGVSRSALDKLRLKSGGLFPEGVCLKRKLWFQPAAPGRADAVVATMMADAKAMRKQSPAVVASSDGTEFVAVDARRGETLRIALADLPGQFDFLLPIGGFERYATQAESGVDVKATKCVAKLYDAICANEPRWREPANRHAMNLFMTRVLFCMFADRTSIFERDLFVRSVAEMTAEDGSDLSGFLSDLFAVMNLPEGDARRKRFPNRYARFRYVNGGLFRDTTPVPSFTSRARRLLLDAAAMDWSEINPDIFGSMIQSVVNEDLRDDLGMHYTSVPNIMKVLRPLVLDDLEGQFSAAGSDLARLKALLARIRKIRFFDPACGSGNFLIVAYKELRGIEMRAFERLRGLKGQAALPMSEIRLDQFHGIEYDDFAAETAKLSLWIAQHQMNTIQERTFGSAPPALPLTESGRIVCGNSVRKDWGEVCPPDDAFETFVVGNPPYLGSVQQTDEQKEDMRLVFDRRVKGYKNLDYIAPWFVKAADYVADGKATSAFVTTNSICQGEQVALLWPSITAKGVEIGFAHTTFKWRNNASKNAGVACAIIGLRKASKEPKRLFTGEFSKTVDNVSYYLTSGENLVVEKRQTSISGLPGMVYGNKATDGGNLIMSAQEAHAIRESHADAGRFLFRFVGAQEFIRGIERWCLWIEDGDRAAAEEIPAIADRLDRVAAMRVDSVKANTKLLADRPHAFGEVFGRMRDNAIVIPRHSSENRSYLPVGYVSDRSVIGDSAFAIYDAPEHLMAILCSRMMMVWTAAVGGRLEDRLRFSNTLAWNTFPLPALSSAQRETLADRAKEIVRQRELNVGATIADLYDPKAMPEGLRQAHRDLDEALESIYQGKPFADDAARLEHLFKLYRTMSAKAARSKAAA